MHKHRLRASFFEQQFAFAPDERSGVATPINRLPLRWIYLLGDNRLEIAANSSATVSAQNSILDSAYKVYGLIRHAFVEELLTRYLVGGIPPEFHRYDYRFGYTQNYGRADDRGYPDSIKAWLPQFAFGALWAQRVQSVISGAYHAID